MRLLSKIGAHLLPTTTWDLVCTKYQSNPNLGTVRSANNCQASLWRRFFTFYLILLSLRVIGVALTHYPTAAQCVSPFLKRLITSDASLDLLLSGFQGNFVIALSFSLVPLYCVAIHYWILIRPLTEIWWRQYANLIRNADDFWTSNRNQVPPLQVHFHLGPLKAPQDFIKQIQTLWNCKTALFTTVIPDYHYVSVTTRIRAILISLYLEKVGEPVFLVAFAFSLILQLSAYLYQSTLQNSQWQSLFVAIDYLLFGHSLFKTFQLVTILFHMALVCTFIALATLQEQGRILDSTVAWLSQHSTPATLKETSLAPRMPMGIRSLGLAQFQANQMIIHRGVLLYNDQLVSIFMLLTLLAIAPVSIAFSSMLLTGHLSADKKVLARAFQAIHIGAVLLAVYMFNLVCTFLYSRQASLYTVQMFIKGNLCEKWRLLRHYELLNTAKKQAFSIGAFGRTINRESFFRFTLLYYSFILYLSKLLISKHNTANK